MPTSVDYSGYFQQMLGGVSITVQMLLWSFVISLAIGTVFGILRTGASGVVQIPLTIYISIMTGVPSLLILFIIYYGGSGVLTALLGYDRSFDVSPFSSGVAAIAMVNAAYVCDLVHGAIRNLPKGQFEACTVLGLPRFHAWRLILLPQVFRLALPGLVNIWIIILKETSLVSLVGLSDLVTVAKTAGGATSEPFVFLIVASFFYIAMSTLTVPLANRLERRLNRGQTPVGA
ncbi:ABC transporter permease subunit [Pseudooceanicola sp. CBS1P-1]|uniref:ABC transporter permease subunit n=1 Tax=Pseudooceanicola albus TaxID=2692189 RepID=A0A6L7G9E4_9RHOB|nr:MULTISPECIES: ABC transporter permease subunit [Pseudooceanicola]MBT9386585.1 ABC transporter permease subunit [Pseudooceanicola endophyticus]MXN20701.1 ABC transporter permease subunit [Pseudooceanicola albus]